MDAETHGKNTDKAGQWLYDNERKAGDTGDISVLIYDPVEFDNYFSGREGEIRINNLFGDFALKTYRFSPYEYMKKFEKLSELTDKMLSDELMDLIDRSLSPESSVSIIKSNGTYKTMFKIEPREILLLSFEKLRA